MRRLLLLVGLALATGCGGYVYATTTVRAPPTPYVEVAPPAPGPAYVWVDGYWQWTGVQYVWVRGYWAVPPQPGFVWSPAGWILDGGTYVFVHGRWVPPSRRTTVRYVHPRRPATVRVRTGNTYRVHRPPRVRTGRSRRQRGTTVRVR
ncbi:MAG TPA: hypothetical protein RMG45_31225 [Polyangiaceae bacterium LLY-WYZ-15_(1-7)]|nr:hypothetical protein [Polyangiaceae bacterium LLY-WYZ-15_(1-7)]